MGLTSLPPARFEVDLDPASVAQLHAIDRQTAAITANASADLGNLDATEWVVHWRANHVAFAATCGTGHDLPASPASVAPMHTRTMYQHKPSGALGLYILTLTFRHQPCLGAVDHAMFLAGISVNSHEPMPYRLRRRN